MKGCKNKSMVSSSVYALSAMIAFAQAVVKSCFFVLDLKISKFVVKVIFIHNHTTGTIRLQMEQTFSP